MLTVDYFCTLCVWQ